MCLITLHDNLGCDLPVSDPEPAKILHWNQPMGLISVNLEVKISFIFSTADVVISYPPKEDVWASWCNMIVDTSLWYKKTIFSHDLGENKSSALNP